MNLIAYIPHDEAPDMVRSKLAGIMRFCDDGNHRLAAYTEGFAAESIEWTLQTAIETADGLLVYQESDLGTAEQIYDAKRQLSRNWKEFLVVKTADSLTDTRAMPAKDAR